MLAVLGALVAAGAVVVGDASGSGAARRAPIVTIVRHGGLCVTGTECRWVLRITDTAVTGQGYVSRPLSARERAALLRAIGRLDLGAETIYRFRGFPYPVASCTYDLRCVEAVRLVERLLATLRS
jgi:hypothetical protein